MAAIYVNGIKTSCMAIGGGGTDISEMVRLTEAEWSNLQTKDEDKIYLICNDQKDMIRKMYQGNRRILKKEDISEYEIWYEDLWFPYYLATSSGYTYSADRYAFDTDLEPFSSENYQRSFEVCCKINPILNQNYGNIMASHSYRSNKVFQFYFYRSDNGIGTAFKSDGNTIEISSDCRNKDLRMVVDRSNQNACTVSIYIDDVLAGSAEFTNFTDSDNPLRIGLYDTYSPFNGYIDYIGFKWLD